MMNKVLEVTRKERDRIQALKEGKGKSEASAKVLRLREILAKGWGCNEKRVRSLVSEMLDIPVKDLEKDEKKMEFKDQAFLALKEEDGRIIVNLGQTDGDFVYFRSKELDVNDETRYAGSEDVLASVAEIKQWFKEYLS